MMSGGNYIDWNGNGRLDPQDLVTGTAMDYADNKRVGKYSQQEPQGCCSGCLGCGCMLNIVAVISIAAIVALIMVIL
jgi:hypothetical protein